MILDHVFKPANGTPEHCRICGFSRASHRSEEWEELDPHHDVMTCRQPVCQETARIIRERERQATGEPAPRDRAAMRRAFIERAGEKA